MGAIRQCGESHSSWISWVTGWDSPMPRWLSSGLRRFHTVGDIFINKEYVTNKKCYECSHCKYSYLGFVSLSKHRIYIATIFLVVTKTGELNEFLIKHILVLHCKKVHRHITSRFRPFFRCVSPVVYLLDLLPFSSRESIELCATGRPHGAWHPRSNIGTSSIPRRAPLQRLQPSCLQHCWQPCLHWCYSEPCSLCNHNTTLLRALWLHWFDTVFCRISNLAFSGVFRCLTFEMRRLFHWYNKLNSGALDNFRHDKDIYMHTMWSYPH